MRGEREDVKVIGLTGTSGSGKGYVCSVFAELGISSIDTDALVHALYESCTECKDELAKEFGCDIFDSCGTVRRKVLAAKVFSDRSRLASLNHIVHKYVIRECESIIKKAADRGDRAIIVDAPQLFEAKMDERCDLVIAVVADVEIRRARLAKRDAITPEEIDRRIRNQHTDSFFAEKADYVIENNGTADIKSAVMNILASEGLL